MKHGGELKYNKATLPTTNVQSEPYKGEASGADVDSKTGKGKSPDSTLMPGAKGDASHKRQKNPVF